ncbi:MAG: hypothetical protein LUD19_01765 [Clostridia bacterium]|nr:hypothetical protein [Clostridia bacterium]
MTEDILSELHSVRNMKNSIIGSVALDTANCAVTINLITDCAYEKSDFSDSYAILRRYVPQEFSFTLEISKVTPDAEMVRHKIYSVMCERFPALSAVMTESDVAVKNSDGGFYFEVATVRSPQEAQPAVDSVVAELKKHFCGSFTGKAVKANVDLSSIEVETAEDEPEYTFIPRTFAVNHFVPIETVRAPERAVYIADFDYTSESTFVCGYIADIEERSYVKRSTGEDKPYYVFTLNDSTGVIRLTYFTRKKSIDKIKTLVVGEGIVCECKSEVHNGYMRYTAINIDRGTPPENFVPEKRPSKPVPSRYNCIKPQPFTDYTQGDLFTDDTLPACLKENVFVVFDLETTGLQTAPVNGEMDGIIEIGAYKIINGAISEKFSTFVNPERKTPLPQRITELTGITDEQVNSAPSYKDVIPDFVKFCDGAILVGHNVVGFDFRFIDHYSKALGYEIDGKLIDTLTLSQQILRLSNNKLNTVAEHFGITFNHHRAEDDALATAKIFIELIKIKKSLPTLS